MALYYNKGGKLKEVKEKPFKLEKDIQRLFEANLNSVMGLELVKSEFTIEKFSEISELTKKVREEIYNLLVNEFSYFE